MCAKKHQFCAANVKEATKYTFEFLRDEKVGSWWHIRVSGEAGYDKIGWFRLCYNRFGGPRLNMVCTCSFSEPDLAVTMNDHEVGYEPLMNVTYLARFFIDAGEDHGINTIWVARAPVDRTVSETKGDVIHVCEDWEEKIIASETRVFPPLQHVHGAVKLAVDKSIAGLKGLGDKTKWPRISKDPDAGKVRVTGPSVGRRLPASDGGDESGSDAVSDAIPYSNGSSDDEADPPPPPPLPPPVPLDPAAREVRVRVWGPWSISEVWSGGTHTGYGANCYCHFGSAAACKKNIKALIGGTLGEARVLCKSWLLMGRDIATHLPDARARHVLHIKRADIPVRDEAEMDAIAAGL